MTGSEANAHRRQRWTWIAIAAVLPCAVIFWGSGWYVWNHFLEGPFLQDSGWYSAIVYHQGFFPKNPPAGHPEPAYYSIHVSLAVSLGSLLSYGFPGDRVDWYCLFQGAIYAPLGALAAIVVGRNPNRSTVRDAAVVGAAGLTFALNGLVFECAAFPHYEIVVPVGIGVMLAALGRGRSTFAWLGLAVAVGGREDGGLHALSFLVAVLACDFSKKPFPVRRRLVLTMAATALGLSLLAFAVQKIGFHSAGLFRHEYLGDPPFAHLDGASIAHRATRFARDTRFIALPLLATIAIAVATRDPRYLLGWIVELPWLVLNFLAAQELKSRFELYTGFPFIVSILWVAVYAHLCGGSRRRTLALLAAVAMTSTVGAFSSHYPFVTYVCERAVWPRPIPRAELLSFSRTLRDNPRAYGPIYVDPGVASWTLERLPPDFLYDTSKASSPAYFDGVEGFAFFRNGLSRGTLADALATSAFQHCGRIRGTEVFFCTREGHPLPPEFEAHSPLLESLWVGDGVTRTPEGYEVPASPSRLLRVWGPFASLSRGRYEASWEVAWRSCTPGDGPVLETDVFVPFQEIAHLKVMKVGDPVRITFDLSGPNPTDGVELRTHSGRCNVLLRDVRLAKP